ncbi:hypothetical protein BB560_002933, partial [Smittium megazygosporum]
LVTTFVSNLPTQNISYRNVSYNHAFTGKTALDTISSAFNMQNRELCFKISQKLLKYEVYYPLIPTLNDPYFIDIEVFIPKVKDKDLQNSPSSNHLPLQNFELPELELSSALKNWLVDENPSSISPSSRRTSSFRRSTSRSKSNQLPPINFDFDSQFQLDLSFNPSLDNNPLNKNSSESSTSCSQSGNTSAFQNSTLLWNLDHDLHPNSNNLPPSPRKGIQSSFIFSNPDTKDYPFKTPDPNFLDRSSVRSSVYSLHPYSPKYPPTTVPSLDPTPIIPHKTISSEKSLPAFPNKSSISIPDSAYDSNALKKKSTSNNFKKSLFKPFGRSVGDLKTLWVPNRISSEYDPPKLSKAPSSNSNANFSSEPKRQVLWSHLISPEELCSYSPQEISWQETIHETIETEKDYVDDLLLIEKIYIDPLRSSGIIPSDKIESLIDRLFLNYSSLIDLNLELVRELSQRQQQFAGTILPSIGDIFLKWSENLEPFITFSINIQLAQVALEAEMYNSKEFAQFIYNTEKNPLSRKLPIQSFLSRPSARFAKYPLLLCSILKFIPKNRNDTEVNDLELVLTRVKYALAQINDLNFDQVKKLRILRLATLIKTTSDEARVLDIENENRELLLEDDFYKSDGSVVHAFLFDNCFILASQKKVPHVRGMFEYSIQKSPLPLMLLSAVRTFKKDSELIHPLAPKKLPFGKISNIISKSHSSQPTSTNTTATSGLNLNKVSDTPQMNTVNSMTSMPHPGNIKSSVSYSNFGSNTHPSSIYNTKTFLTSAGTNITTASTATFGNFLVSPPAQVSYTNVQLKPGNVDAISTSVPITFSMMSNLGWEIILWAATPSIRDAWIDTISNRVSILNSQASAKLEFNLLTKSLLAGFIPFCIADYTSSNGDQMRMIGAADGIYLMQINNGFFINRVCPLPNVKNIVVMSKFNVVILQYGKTVSVLNLSDLENPSNWNTLNRGTKLSSNISYFDVGVYMDHPMLILMKYRNNKSLFKCLSLVKIDPNKSPPANSMIVYQNFSFGLQISHEFYIDGICTSVFFFKKKLCITNGSSFDVVDVVNQEIVQSLPRNINSSDLETSIAMSIHRVSNIFLLCFEDYAIYVDRRGLHVFPDLVIQYLIKPKQFSFVYPNYLIIIGDEFVEIRYADTGDLFLILRIPGVRCLDINPNSASIYRSTNLGDIEYNSPLKKNKSVLLSMKACYLPPHVIEGTSDTEFQQFVNSDISQSHSYLVVNSMKNSNSDDVSSIFSMGQTNGTTNMNNPAASAPNTNKLESRISYKSSGRQSSQSTSTHLLSSDSPVPFPSTPFTSISPKKIGSPSFKYPRSHRSTKSSTADSNFSVDPNEKLSSPQLTTSPSFNNSNSHGNDFKSTNIAPTRTNRVIPNVMNSSTFMDLNDTRLSNSNSRNSQYNQQRAAHYPNSHKSFALSVFDSPALDNSSQSQNENVIVELFFP